MRFKMWIQLTGWGLWHRGLETYAVKRCQWYDTPDRIIITWMTHTDRDRKIKHSVRRHRWRSSKNAVLWGYTVIQEPSWWGSDSETKWQRWHWIRSDTPRHRWLGVANDTKRNRWGRHEVQWDWCVLLAIKLNTDEGIQNSTHRTVQVMRFKIRSAPWHRWLGSRRVVGSLGYRRRHRNAAVIWPLAPRGTSHLPCCFPPQCRRWLWSSVKE